MTAKGTLMQAIVGGVSYYGHKLAADNVSFVAENFWVGPAAMALLGHFAKRSQRFGSAGAALVGAAGYSLAMGFALNQKSSETKGIVDTGAFAPSQLPDNMSTQFNPMLSGFYPQESAGIYDQEGEVSEAYNIGR
jgi:hypothetical protein